MTLLTAVFAVTACSLSLTRAAFVVSSAPRHSHACFGSTGLVQTSNFLDCDPFSKLPRICVRYAAYGSKKPGNGNITCPSGVSSEVDPVCCRPLFGDCIVRINVTDTFKLQKECSHQSLSTCRIPVDQRMDDKFLPCTRTFRSSTFRYINYVCITDNDADARAKGCYVKPPSTKSTTTTTTISTPVKPSKSRSPAQSSANGLTPLISIIPVLDASTTERTRYYPHGGSEAPTTTTTYNAGGQITSVLSKDEKIIIGISVTAIVLIGTVIVVMAVRAFHKRSLMRKRNAWVANTLNEDLHHRNSKNKIVTTDVEGTPDNGEKKPPTESGTVYEEISEVPADLVTTKPVKKQAPKMNGHADVNSPVDDNVNLNNHANSDNNNAQNYINVDDGLNQDELIAMKSLNLNNKNIDEPPSMIKIKSIGNHQYQEVGLSPKNPLYKLNGFANSDNRTYDAKTRMIVDKISNTDQINVFKKKSKHRKGVYRDGYDSETGTLRRVAKFVKKCIRDIDTTDEPTTGKSKKRRRRNSESEIPHLTRHNKVSEKGKAREKSIVVKPWDFIRGDQLRQIYDDKRGPLKSSLMKKKKNSENDVNYRNHRKKVNDDDNETSQCSETSSYEEVPCRFPVRKASFMKRKNRKNGDTDSMLSSMESDNSNLRNLEVRFHNKLTYISPDKRDKTPRREDDQNRRRNKKSSDNVYDKPGRTKTERKERNNEDKTIKSRGNLYELEGAKVNNRRRHREDNITRDDEVRRSLRKINSHRDSSRTEHKVRRNSTRGKIRTTPSSQRVRSKSKHKSPNVSHSRGKHSSKGTHHHSKRSTKVHDHNYVTDSDENTGSSSQDN